MPQQATAPPNVDPFVNRGAMKIDRDLLRAARQGKTEMVVALLREGADINVTADDGRTPLHHAAAGGHTDTAIALIRHSPFEGALVRLLTKTPSFNPVSVPNRRFRASSVHVEHVMPAVWLQNAKIITC